MAGAEGPDGHPGESVLRLLAADRDQSVRTRAATLLLRLRHAPAQDAAAAPAAKKASSPQPAAAASPAEPPTSAADGGNSEAGRAAASPAAGNAAADAAAGATPPDVAAATGPPAAGPSGSDPAPADGSGTGIDPGIEQLGKEGLRALASGESGRAQQLFERARARCAHARQNRAVCSPRITELTYQLARAFESQGQLAEAMAEYQKVAHASGAARAKGEQRSRALEAMIRLAPRLGRIIITQLVQGKCKEQEKLLPPGSQMVNIGGQLKSVKLRAGETVTLATCQPGSRSKGH